MTKIKAGMIPYYIDTDGEIKMLFQESSDPDFGGPDPMISKGGLDKGETLLECAMREGLEELGLTTDNYNEPVHMWKSTMYGYELNVFMCKVKDPDALVEPDYETKAVHWLSLSEFEEVGRPDHKFIVRYFDSKIREIQ
jgi:8-oxo-dGTP pyrophosphatase MutT (NUDIX family)